MIVDGRLIANRIYKIVHELVVARGVSPRLGIITCVPNFETQKYLELKKRKAAEAGIVTEVVVLGETVNTDVVLTALDELVLRTDGIVVQLPLPPSVDLETIMQHIPASHDADVLNPNTTAVYSPVVGAIQEIFRTYSIGPHGKYVTIIGSGRLVGIPASQWFQSQGAYVSVVTKDTMDIAHYTKNADIIVCGAGVPNLLTTDMVKEGVIVLDAGTSEEGGILKGDVDPLVALKASLFTPVPGGIGPITIAVLLRNVVELAEKRG